MSFAARYAGTCTDCENPIAPGDTIRRAGRRYAHTDCTAASSGGNEHKARTGRCEDAPCCGCCGGWQESETAYAMGYR